jgi:hypothetical protein
MTELLRTDYMTATLDGALLTLAWQREEPNDDSSVATAKLVAEALDKLLAEKPQTRVRVLVDLTVVKKTFPRGTAAYTAWLLKRRANVIGGAFVTKSMIMRAFLAGAVLVPGITMKGFGDVADARAFVLGLPG